MVNLQSILSLFNRSIVPAASSSVTLNVPSNLHVFHSYYSNHFSYKYEEEYSFLDKVLIFNNSSAVNHKNINLHLLKDLKFSGKRRITSADHYSSRHGIKQFIDWSHNSFGESIKDILNVDIDAKNGYFVPMNKSIYLDYSHQHTPEIPLYALYFDGETGQNHYSHINFGKHKSTFKTLSEFTSLDKSINSCKLAWKAQQSLDFYWENERGYEGKCDRIAIGGHNVNFPDLSGDKVMWSTPYAAYKFLVDKGWDEQYYYYTLGEFQSSKGRSKNLISNHDSFKSWIVNYDDVFSISLDVNNNLMISLNYESEILKSIDFFNLNKNSNLENFLKVSSYFDFELSFKQFGRPIYKKFSLKDVLSGSAFISTHSAPLLFSDFAFSIKPNHESIVLAGNESNASKYYFRINVDALHHNNRFFDKLIFKIDDHDKLFPSELLDVNKLSKYFFLVNNNDGAMTPVDANFMKYLNFSGELDDIEGTANIRYRFNDQTYNLNLENMKTIPDLSGIKIWANDKQDALHQLKKLHKDSELDYFWNNLIFQEKPSFFDPAELTLKISNKPFNKLSNLRLKKKWNFDDCEIKILSFKDLFPIKKRFIPTSYEDVSELFDLNEYARYLNLSKSDYEYKVIDSTDSKIEILVTLDPSKFPESAKLSNNNKKYIFDLAKSNLNDNLKEAADSQWWQQLFKSENIVWTGSCVIFAASTLILVLKKCGVFRFKSKQQ